MSQLDTTKVKEAEMYQELQSIYLKYNQRKRPLSGQIYETITLIDKYTREARIDELKELQMAPNVSDDAKDENYTGYIKDRIAHLAEQKDGE